MVFHDGILGIAPGTAAPNMNLENCLPYPCMDKNGIAQYNFQFSCETFDRVHQENAACSPFCMMGGSDHKKGLFWRKLKWFKVTLTCHHNGMLV